jgi:hypothetical protein
VVDIDRLGDDAVALVVTEDAASTFGPGMVEEWICHRTEQGWTHLGAGAGGSCDDPLLAREQWHQTDGHLFLSGSGGTYLEPEKRRGKSLQHAQVLCAPDVARVEIDKPTDCRDADVSSGPGWLIVLWAGGTEPTLTAFDADGVQLDVLRPETAVREHASRGRSRWPRRWSTGGRIVTVDDPILTELHERLRDVQAVEERRAIHDQLHARLLELNDGDATDAD